MSTAAKCKTCGSADIEVDNARGDAVCTNCGSVLEDSIVVSEVQFEEGAQGSSHVVGEFVSANSKAPHIPMGASFYLSRGLESREITLRKARNSITIIGSRLRMTQHCIETACNFFSMALSRNLTRGRRNTHVHAACVYLACRTENISVLLIDISDILQICCYELGRTYLKLSQALHINIPTMDPCLYTMRFAGELQFGTKTQQVTNTALRLLQRMKRDSMHYGRKPSGLCGAALLIASRLHEFNRTINDIVKIVRVHESTMRKRLIEFGDTPSSGLTLDEFLTIDLDEEQDPPSFKVARRKDKDRVQKILDDEAERLSQLQREIEKELNKNRRPCPSSRSAKIREALDTEKFIEESTNDTVKKIITEESEDDPDVAVIKNEPKSQVEGGLGPDTLVASMGLAKSLHDTSNSTNDATGVSTDGLPGSEVVEVSLDDLDDEELDTYIMSESEFHTKQGVWHRQNAAYLKEQQLKEERLQKEREEGKPEKKKRKSVRKKAMGPVNSAGEAIEKILREKKISSKINYDVLKSLAAPPSGERADNEDDDEVEDVTSSKSTTVLGSIKRRRLSSVSSVSSGETPTPTRASAMPNLSTARGGKRRKQNPVEVGLNLASSVNGDEAPSTPVKKELDSSAVSEEEDYYYDDDNTDNQATQEADLDITQILRQHQEGLGEDVSDDYGSDDMEEW